MLSHANLVAERDAAFSVVDVSEQDSVLGVLPLFHALAQLANLLLPFAVEPSRSVAPAANNMASARLVFPAPAGPTSAIARVPLAIPGMRLSLRPFGGRASR